MTEYIPSNRDIVEQYEGYEHPFRNEDGSVKVKLLGAFTALATVGAAYGIGQMQGRDSANIEPPSIVEREVALPDNYEDAVEPLELEPEEQLNEMLPDIDKVRSEYETVFKAHTFEELTDEGEALLGMIPEYSVVQIATRYDDPDWYQAANAFSATTRFQLKAEIGINVMDSAVEFEDIYVDGERAMLYRLVAESLVFTEPGIIGNNIIYDESGANIAARWTEGDDNREDWLAGLQAYNLNIATQIAPAEYADLNGLASYTSREVLEDVGGENVTPQEALVISRERAAEQQLLGNFGLRELMSQVNQASQEKHGIELYPGGIVVEVVVAGDRENARMIVTNEVEETDPMTGEDIDVGAEVEYAPETDFGIPRYVEGFGLNPSDVSVVNIIMGGRP